MIPQMQQMKKISQPMILTIPNKSPVLVLTEPTMSKFLQILTQVLVNSQQLLQIMDLLMFQQVWPYMDLEKEDLVVDM